MERQAEVGHQLMEQLLSLMRQVIALQELVISTTPPMERAVALPAIRPDGEPAPRSKSQLSLPEILDSGPIGMALMDSDFNFLNVNTTLCRMLGFSEQELLARKLSEVTYQPDVNNCADLVGQVRRGVSPHVHIDRRLVKKSGEVFWVQLTVSLVRDDNGDPLCSLAIVQDIGERKSAEEELRSERQIFEGLIHCSMDGIFSFDRNCVITLWNPGMQRISGIAASEAIGKPVVEALPFLKELGEDESLQAALKGERVHSRARSYFVPQTGKRACFEASYGPIRNNGDEVLGGIAIIRDTLGLEEVREGEGDAEEHYREIFDNAGDIIYTHDLQGSITSLNKAAETITGYTRAEALQMKLNQLVAPEFREAVRQKIDRQIAGETSGAYAFEIAAKDGHRIALEVCARPIYRGGSPVAILGIARDITERIRSEQALETAHRKLRNWVSELEDRTGEMTLLSEMGDMLRACLTTEEAYNVISRVAPRVFPVHVGALYVISPSREALDAAAVWGDTALVERVFAPDECWALRRGRMHWVESTKSGLLCKHLHQPAPGGYLCVPMMAQSESLGILHLSQPANATFPEAKQHLAMAMADHIAMALSNLRMHEALRTQSIRDPHTGLFNRSFMEETLELELRRSARSQRPLGIILLEIDQFEKFCEDFNRDAVNAVLRDLAGLLQSNVRREDLACMFSERIFVVILPLGDLAVARQRAENVRKLTKGLSVKFRSRSVKHVTISVGVAVFPEHGRTSQALLRAAEVALNRAREAGGDAVVTVS